jgi:hypothetical protein
MSSTITTTLPSNTPFEQVSGEWSGFLALKPYSNFKRSQMRPGTRDSRLDFTRMATIIALGNWLSRLQVVMSQQGLSVSELVLVLWVLQCFEPGLRSFLARSLAKELVPENVGFNTLKLHLEAWSSVITAREHRVHWNKTTKGDVDIVEFWATQGAQKHSELVRRWQDAWDWLSGMHGMLNLLGHWIKTALTSS